MAASVILNRLLLIIILKQTTSCHFPTQTMSLPLPCRQKNIHAPWHDLQDLALCDLLLHLPILVEQARWTLTDQKTCHPLSLLGLFLYLELPFSSLCAETPLILQEDIHASPFVKPSGHLSRKNHFLLSPPLKHLVHPGFVSPHVSFIGSESP